MEREIAREVERKSTTLPFYPKTGTATVADSTARMMEALKLDEKQLQIFKLNRPGLSFKEFLTAIRNHELLKEPKIAERKAYREFIRNCEDCHRKDEDGEMVLDKKKVSTSIHPLYDLYRFYKQY